MEQEQTVLGILWAIILDETKRSEDRINAIRLWSELVPDIPQQHEEERSLSDLVAANSYTLRVSPGSPPISRLIIGDANLPIWRDTSVEEEDTFVNPANFGPQ